MNWLPREEIIAPVTEEEREAVRGAQRVLQIPVTGEMDETTRASLRGLQRLFGHEVTGVLDKATAALLGRLAPDPARE